MRDNTDFLGWRAEKKAVFQSEQKVRSKNGLIYSCHKKYTEEKWYHEIGQSVFFQTKDA